MSGHPIRDPKVQALIERRCAMLESYSAGNVSVEFVFNLKDGRWTAGNVSVTFPRSVMEATE